MTINSKDTWIQAKRIGGLRRFGLAITVLNILGHTVFGFEQSWAQPFAALATTFTCELFCEWMEARAEDRPPRFLGSWRELVDFLLPAHITGLAVAMLLYSGDRLLPTVLAAAIAIASKNTLRLKLDGRLRHFFNPSNFGITIILLLFPWVGIAPPYHFTENLAGAGYWILPAIICVTGTTLNLKFTGKLPLIAAWWGGFVTQAAVRTLVFGTPLLGAINPMTGVAFLLFSFYMVTDPATTPFDNKSQMLFGLSVAAAYGLLVSVHVVFGMFFGLTAVSGLRGLAQYVGSRSRSAYPTPVPARAAAGVALRKTA
jgi:hypothetical protein